MATHRLFLDSTPAGDENIGNSMSTSYSWLPEVRKLWVTWKNESKQFDVPTGIEFVSVRCDGGFPRVTMMTPPTDPVAYVAWRHKFYKGKRVNDRKIINTAAEEAKRVNGFAWIVEGEGFLFFWGPRMAGQVGTPALWWADDTANPDKIRIAFDNFFNRGAEAA